MVEHHSSKVSILVRVQKRIKNKYYMPSLLDVAAVGLLKKEGKIIKIRNKNDKKKINV